MTVTAADFINCPGITQEYAERLALFAQTTGTTPPTPTVTDGTDEDAILTREFRAYCWKEGLSLDWFAFGAGSMFRHSEPVDASA